MPARQDSGITPSADGSSAANNNSHTPCSTLDALLRAPAWTLAALRTMTAVRGSEPSAPHTAFAGALGDEFLVVIRAWSRVEAIHRRRAEQAFGRCDQGEREHRSEDAELSQQPECVRARWLDGVQ